MSGQEPKPGEPVALFAYPMPLTASAYIAEVIERVYGSGDTTMSFDGEAMRIYAPKEGFGPRRKGRVKAERPKDTDASVGFMRVRDEVLSMTLEDSQDVILVLADHLRNFFELTGGINYVEAKFGTPETPGDEIEYALVVQKLSGRTAHDLRREAEDENAALVIENERLRQRISALEAAQA